VLFVGTHERQLDDKGRLALPAPFRALLGEHCYLAKGLDKCIDVIPAETFERDAHEAMEAVRRGEATRSSQRALAGSAALVTLDRQGRVKIDDALLQYAEIPVEHPVLVTGNFDRFEIWQPERRRRIDTAGDDELAGGDE
jgi:MraZ protein